MAEIKASGAIKLQAVPDELNARGVRTAMGARWGVRKSKRTPGKSVRAKQGSEQGRRSRATGTNQKVVAALVSTTVASPQRAVNLVLDQGKLSKYRAKRDFSKTAEPSGDNRIVASQRRRFVIQKHDATRLHYDLRLELALQCFTSRVIR